MAKKKMDSDVKNGNKSRILWKDVVKMTVYIETGYDGKERKFVYGNGYYRKIYKQYKKSLNAWIEQLSKLLCKAKYNQDQIHNIVNHCYNRGYFVSSNYYVKPCSLVQRVNELGYDDLEIV